MRTEEQIIREKLYVLTAKIREEIEALEKRETKVGKSRLRKLTLDFIKLGKEYRKVSVDRKEKHNANYCKNGKRSKK